MRASTALLTVSFVCAACMTAPAQSVVEPERQDAAASAFESAQSGPPLRCEIAPQRPALTYALQFRTGYVLNLPLNQPGGIGHSFTILSRVTPDGKPPVYLSMDASMTKAPSVPGNAEIEGGFLVGEGDYGVAVLVRDENGRVCHNQWRAQAKPVGSERDLRSRMPAGAVEELGSPIPSHGGGPEIQRLTILVHAVANNPRAAKIEEWEVQHLSNTVSSLLAQLPVRSVRLAVFNLERQVVLLSKDNFGPQDLDELTRTLERVQLGILDVRTLENPVDVLSDLLLKELRNSKPPDAVVVIGPRTIQQTAGWPRSALPAAPECRCYYLQYQEAAANTRVLRAPPPMLPIPNPGRPEPRVSGPIPAPAVSRPAADGIELLLHSLNGAILPVRQPHDLADAIERMASAIPMVNTPREARVTEPVRPRPLPPLGTARTELPEPAEPTGDEDPVDVLARLRDRVLDHGFNVPNHTCVESVQRDRFEPLSGRSNRSCDFRLAARRQSGSRLRLDLTDWLRLDVGMADGREIFSWAGAAKFDDREIDELIPDGAFGTGPFASMLLSVFANRNPHFIFDGETTFDSVRVFQYSYSVPLEESHYRVKAHKEWLVTGFTGTLLVNPKSDELARFIVRTDELPPATGTCEVDTTLDYAPVRLEGFAYLLPA